MPLYEYECDAQQHRFEVIQKFSDPPVESCPTCGSPVHKLIASPAFQFKGTGWYITDYAKKDSGGEGKNASSAKDTPSTGEKGDKGDGASKADGATKTDAPATPPASDKSST